jgi:hypothetical protein
MIYMFLCIRTVDTLEPNRSHIRNQYDRRGSAGHSFSRKVTSGQITEENATPLMLFYGKTLYHRVYSLIEMMRSNKFRFYSIPVS